MTDPLTTDTEAGALQVAHARYIDKLCAFNRLRCRRDERETPTYGLRLVEARREAKEAYAEWVMLAQLGPGTRAA